MHDGNVHRAEARRSLPLCNGQVWQQTEFWTWAWTWSGPSVLIFQSPYGGGYRMKVLLSGVPHVISVVRIR